MPMIHLISIVLVPFLLLWTNGSYGNTHWTERNITWLNTSGKNWDFKLRLCASRENELMCRNFFWRHDEQHHWSKSVCKANSSKPQPCTNQQFHQIWSDYPTCKCISESAKGETTSYFTTSASATTPITHYSDTISAQTSKILAILVALLTVLVVLMIIGWIWTCWVVKKLKTQIESSQTSKKFKKKGCKLKSESGAATTKRGFCILMSLSAINSSTTTAYSNYENAQPGDTTSTQSTFQSSTEYSLLHPTTKTNGEMIATGEDSVADIVNAEEYHKLDREKERSRAKASAPWSIQRGGGKPENYSQLILD